MLSALAFGHGIIFVALSILTSQIVLGGTVVSKPTSTCGIWWPLDREAPDWSLTYHELNLNATLDADNYVQNCYFGSSKTGIFDCHRLMSQSIPFSVSTEDGCPFAHGVCRINSSFVMDTGNISVADLGINTELAHQLVFRRKSTCAPVQEEPFYVRTLNFSDPETESKMAIDVYRIDFGQGDETMETLARTRDRSTCYNLAAYFHPIDDSTKSDDRMAPLQLEDELRAGHHGPSLVYLSGKGIVFPNKSDDPVWSVHTESRFINGTYGGVDFQELPPMYEMDKSLNIIGCDERIQICHKTTHQCTPWSGLIPLFNSSDLDDRAMENRNAAFDIDVPISIFNSFVVATSIPASIAYRAGSGALRATRTMWGSEQVYLEPEQWKTELTYWFAMAMARLQLDVYKTIEKPENLDATAVQNKWSLGETPLKNVLCGRIKFVSPNHTSSSFFGIMLTLTLSFSLIVLSFFEVFIDRIPMDWWGSWTEKWILSENVMLLEGKSESESRLLV